MVLLSTEFGMYSINSTMICATDLSIPSWMSSGVDFSMMTALLF